VLDADKYTILHRADINACDLLLSCPSTILGRERAIVLNLEVCPPPLAGSEVFFPGGFSWSTAASYLFREFR
jgi:hypothetical protein